MATLDAPSPTKPDASQSPIANADSQEAKVEASSSSAPTKKRFSLRGLGSFGDTMKKSLTGVNFTKTKMTVTESIQTGAQIAYKTRAAVASETTFRLSQAKRKYYCRSGKIEDPTFLTTLQKLDTWKAALESQSVTLKRVIRDQSRLVESNKEAVLALKKVPNAERCGQTATLLGTTMEKATSGLVNLKQLQTVSETIDSLLRDEYTELTLMKKRYQAAKNEADVVAARIENRRNADSQKLHIEMGRATEAYMKSKSDIMALAERTQKRQDTQLGQQFLTASAQEDSGSVVADAIGLR